MEEFNKNLEELEKIVDSLDEEENLDKALELFNKGVELSKKCKEMINTTNENILKVENK